MIYFNFLSYEEFKEMFGIVEHGNGVKSRKNKILLSLYKDKRFFKQHIVAREYRACERMYDKFRAKSSEATYRCTKNVVKYEKIAACYFDRMCEMRSADWRCKVDLLECPSLPVLRSVLMRVLETKALTTITSHMYYLSLNDRLFPSDNFETDDLKGLCEDGTLNAIRYKNMEKKRVFKMKAGKMFNHIMSKNIIARDLPEQIQRWLSEEFVGEWVEYARRNIGKNEYVLHVDDDFESIYNTERCAGYDEDSDSFRSCMVDDEQWTFYRDAVKAKAAYLTDAYGDKIYARCVIFTEVHDCDSDKIWRLAERQYSRFGDYKLQRQLIADLIKDGHIDGYKTIGASCHDSRKFVDTDGNSLEEKDFWIDCKLEDGDTISYQDSFKWFDPEEGTASNYEDGDVQLDTTERRVHFGDDDHEGEVYSEYNDEYIDEDCACYVETRNDYFHDYQTVYAYRYGRTSGRFYEEDCFEDDCIKAGDDFYYAGENAEEPERYGLSKCPYCDEWFVAGRGDSMYSELLEEDYCCDSCLLAAEEQYHEDNGEVMADYDNEWYPQEEVIRALKWYAFLSSTPEYTIETISIDDFNSLVEDGAATEYCGKYYIDELNCDGEPAHLLGAERVVA